MSPYEVPEVLAPLPCFLSKHHEKAKAGGRSLIPSAARAAREPGEGFPASAGPGQQDGEAAGPHSKVTAT